MFSQWWHSRITRRDAHNRTRVNGDIGTQ